MAAHEVAKLAREARVRKIAGFGCAAADVAYLYPELLYVGLAHDPAVLAHARESTPQGIFWDYNVTSETPSPLYLGDAITVCAIDAYGDARGRVLQKMHPSLGAVIVSSRAPGEVIPLVSEHMPGFVFTAVHDPASGETVVSGRREP